MFRFPYAAEMRRILYFYYTFFCFAKPFFHFEKSFIFSI